MHVSVALNLGMELSQGEPQNCGSAQKAKWAFVQEIIQEWANRVQWKQVYEESKGIQSGYSIGREALRAAGWLFLRLFLTICQIRGGLLMSFSGKELGVPGPEGPSPF